MSETTISGAAPRGAPARLRLWAELLVLFVGAPLAMAFVMAPAHFTTVLLGLAAIGVGLLFFTPGFRWRSLFEGKVLAHWRVIAIFFFGAVALIAGTVQLEAPQAFFGLIRSNPTLWAFVMIGYPLVLVTIQELVFRALFFCRYGDLFPNQSMAILANSVVFSLAHLFYWNWPAIVLTFIANFFFAYAYTHKRSFPLAWVLHTISGTLVFTIGLGVFFYHGAIPG